MLYCEDNCVIIDDGDVMKGCLELKLAQLLVELFRGNRAIIDHVGSKQMDAVTTHLRVTKVTLHSLPAVAAGLVHG